MGPERSQRDFWELVNGPGSHKEAFGRSDRSLVTTEIGEFKRALVGYGEFFRSEGL